MSEHNGFLAIDEDDLEPRWEPVTLGKKKYLVRELGTDGGAKYTYHQVKGTKLDAEGRPVGVPESIGTSNAFLVSLCLFEVTVPTTWDGTYYPEQEVLRPVPLQTIQGWPDRVTRAVAERAAKVSGLGAKETKLTLVRKMAELKRQLDAMPADDGPGPGDPKEQPSATTATSATAAS